MAWPQIRHAAEGYVTPTTPTGTPCALTHSTMGIMTAYP